MKNNVKKLLFASVILFLLGIVVCSAALIIAAVTDCELFENFQGDSTDGYTLKFNEIEKRGTFDTEKIYIHGEDLDVIIRDTDGDSYVVFDSPDSQKTSCIIESGILRITDTVPFYMLGLSITDKKPKFTGFRNVFSNGPISTSDKSVSLYLNKNSEFKSIEVDIGIGTIDVSGVTSANIDFSTTIGDVYITDCDFFEKVVVNCGNGNIFSDSCHYAFADLVTSFGDITVRDIGRKTNCETSLGNISVYAEDDPYSYSARATVSHGKIIIDHTVYMGKEYNNNADSESTLWLKALGGNISLYNSVTDE